MDLIGYVLLFPLAGTVINGLLGKKLSKSVVGIIGCTTIGISFILSFFIFIDLLKLAPEHRVFEKDYFTWIGSGTFEAIAGLQVDPLSVVMILVVSGVGFLIHVYSVGYMHDDDGYYRYFTYLNLFTFSMLLLVLANNFLLMFIGWEGVGLVSYLLIGFWFKKESAGLGSLKAFIVNRVGDVGCAVEGVAKQYGFGVVRDFVGHGVGRSMHEEPQIPNFGNPGTGPRLKTGMVFAIEPMLNLGGYEVKVLEDKWTVVTADGSLSAHAEHTVALTENGPEILTRV